MKIVNVSKTYKLKSGEIKALDGITLDLPDRGMIFILGRSGSGKSTLLNLLSGLDSADEGGKIEVGGKNICACSERERDGYRNSRCGFIFQEYNLIPELSVKENVALSRQLQDEKDNDEAVKEALEKVELQGYENRRVTELSGGQKQRAAIARAVVKNPDVVFADEPTGALDEATGECVFTLLKGLSRERLVLVVSHDREFAQKYADRVIELADGKIVGDSDKDYTADEKSAPPFKKPKLPLKAAVKIGCANFRFHPVRLVATLLLSVVSFTFLCLSLNCATTNLRRNYIEAMCDSDMEYAVVYRQTLSPDPSESLWDKLSGQGGPTATDTRSTLSDATLLKSVYGGFVYAVDSEPVYTFQSQFGMPVGDLTTATKDREEMFSITASGCMHIDDEELERAGYTLTGRLPLNASEIAVNENLLNTFTVTGLYENGIKYDFDGAEDLLGHKLLMPHIDENGIKYYGSGAELKTVVGVVRTGCDKACWQTHKNEAAHPHDKIYVSADYYGVYDFMLCEVNGEFDKLLSFVSDDDNDGFYRLSDKISIGYYHSRYYLASIKLLCLYASIVFFVSAFILLTGFIGASVRRQTKLIGILSAMGASRKSLLKIYGLGAAVICGATYAVCLPLSAVLSRIVNDLVASWAEAGFRVLSFQPPTAVLLAVAITACGAAGLLLPLRKIKKLSPAEAINKGQVK